MYQRLCTVGNAYNTRATDGHSHLGHHCQFGTLSEGILAFR